MARGMAQKMRDRVFAFMETYGMIEPGDEIIAGVSGGADSICLADILLSYRERVPFTLRIAHIHHHLRGADADADAAFVLAFGRERGVETEVFHCDVRGRARRDSLSLEEAGRLERYGIFDGLCRAPGVRTALAHHQDDLAETMLHNLVRGTGIAGLASLRPVAGTRIRPLLGVTREEIEAYLREEGLSWRTDSTNADEKYTRNRIRHTVMPALRGINAQAARHMARTAEELAGIEAYLSREAEEKRARYVTRTQEGACARESFLADGIGSEDPFLRDRILLGEIRWAARTARDISRIHIQDAAALFQKQSGRRISLPFGVTALRVPGGVRIRQDGHGGPDAARETGEREKTGVYGLSVPGMLSVDDFTVTCTIGEQKIYQIEEKKYTKWLDYDKIKTSVEFRHRRPGDRITVLASGGRKKVSDYLIDRKIPSDQRDALWLVAAGSDVLWIVGERLSAKYKVTETTRRTLCIQIKGGKFHE